MTENKLRAIADIIKRMMEQQNDNRNNSNEHHDNRVTDDYRRTDGRNNKVAR